MYVYVIFESEQFVSNQTVDLEPFCFAHAFPVRGFSYGTLSVKNPCV